MAIAIFLWAVWCGGIAYAGGYDAGKNGQPPINQVIQESL